jgi:hypothetical protein
MVEDYNLKRSKDDLMTFHVMNYEIKELKLKIKSWNIA